MIPIRDTVPSRVFPIVNISIIAANVLIFLYQQSLGLRAEYNFVLFYGTVPQEVTEGFVRFLTTGFPLPVLLSAIFPLFTANFLHGGWLHLIGNMIYLWVFGDNIESRLGHLRYLFVYLLLGAGGQMAHIFFNAASPIPLVGASAAIAGVLGAYFILYPRSRVLTLVPLGFFITFVHIPAVIFLALWFGLQLLNAVASQSLAMGVQPVAWWAHVGGFALGLALGLLIKKAGRMYRQ